jgi:hypothetical protein
MTRPKAPPEPWEEEWWWHSRPVAKALHILKEVGALVRESGRTDKTPGFYPFYVEIRVTPLTPCSYPKCDQRGTPTGVYLPGDTFFVDTRRDLRAIAQEALRRAQEAAESEEP